MSLVNDTELASKEHDVRFYPPLFT